MRFAPLLALAVTTSALPLGGCLSGQTGSPDCPAPSSCVCSSLQDGNTLMRVHVESANARHLVAVVDEVLATTVVYPATPPAGIGERISGFVVLERRPCDHWDVTRPIAVAGSELLVAFRAGLANGFPYCEERETCKVEECGAAPETERMACWDRCDTETQQICNEYRLAALLDGHFSHALPWSDPLDFGGGKRVALSELALLGNQGACLQRFPIVPAASCDDVESGSCHVSLAAQRSPASSLWLAGLAALAFAAVARCSARGRR